jgi:hypothetical protein
MLQIFSRTGLSVHYLKSKRTIHISTINQCNLNQVGLHRTYRTRAWQFFRIRKMPVSNLHAICIHPDKPYMVFSLHINARRLGFDPRPVRVGFVVDTVTLGHPLPPPRTSVSPCSIIPRVLRSHISLIHHK